MSIGDKVKVRHQSSSPAMTVAEISKVSDKIHCVWWCADRKEFQSMAIGKEALEKVNAQVP